MPQKNKKKKGRPLSTPLARGNVIGLRLNDVETRALANYAWRYDLSMSDVIRESLMILNVIPDSPMK